MVSICNVLKFWHIYRPFDNNGIINTSYLALNSRDLKLATRKLLPDTHNSARSISFGMEFSGVKGNKRVMGICPYGGVGLQCKADEDFVWEIPDHWSLEDAATIPNAYVMVNGILVIILKSNIIIYFIEL